MAFKETNGAESDTSISLGGLNKKTNKPNPTSIEGYYIGSKQIKSDRAKSGFTALYVFQNENGNVGVWGKTDLDKRMVGVKEGVMTRVTFTGMKKIPGKNDMYSYKVEVDESNTLENGSVENDVPNSFDSEDASQDETDLDSDGEAYDTAPYSATHAPKQATATPDAARQAKVQALLAKKPTSARK
jgi:hypothetical protein